jgi:hypothetical protein
MDTKIIMNHILHLKYFPKISSQNLEIENARVL